MSGEVEQLSPLTSPGSTRGRRAHARTRESDDHWHGHVGLDDSNERPSSEVEELPPLASGVGVLSQRRGVCAELGLSSRVRSTRPRAQASGGRAAITMPGCARRAIAELPHEIHAGIRRRGAITASGCVCGAMAELPREIHAGIRRQGCYHDAGVCA